MKVGELEPKILDRFPFSLKFQKYVPKVSGCYVLATFDGDILYIGLTRDLQRRFGQHRETKEKRSKTDQGRAYWFHFWAGSDKDLNRIERTWLNQYRAVHGVFPILNKISSPLA